MDTAVTNVNGKAKNEKTFTHEEYARVSGFSQDLGDQYRHLIKVRAALQALASKPTYEWGDGEDLIVELLLERLDPTVDAIERIHDGFKDVLVL